MRVISTTALAIAPLLCMGVNGWQSQSPQINRRELMKSIGAGVVTGSVIFKANPSTAATKSVDFDVYSVIPDASESLSPSISTVDKKSFFKQISPKKGGVVWLGEHHNAAKDHQLQVDIIRQIHSLRKGSKTAIGLEQVQVRFQPVLDDYIAGKLSIDEMRANVEWDQRWQWPFDVYAPIFETARELKLPLIALNVNSEDLALVEKRGLPGLPREVLGQYIVDGVGFASFAKQRQYATYVEYVIRPSYDMHQRMGILKYTISGEELEEDMSYRNFLSGRILWDEAMATAAYGWTRANEKENGLLVGLVGADHVKFHNGIPGRYSRLVANLNSNKPTTSASSATSTAGPKGSNTPSASPSGKDGGCISVMLNPTLIDSRPSGTVGLEGADATRPDTITLQLRYLKEGVDPTGPDRSLPSSTGGVMPLADYIVIG